MGSIPSAMSVVEDKKAGLEDLTGVGAREAISGEDGEVIWTRRPDLRRGVFSADSRRNDVVGVVLGDFR